METIRALFPELPASSLDALASLKDLYTFWNARINVISRKDMDAFYQHHVLHALSLLRVVSFEAGTAVLDVGTGGGFPGIPLAVCCPETRFLLCDSIGKKLKVVEDVAAAVGLHNVRTFYGRAETLPARSFEYVVSRAVTTLPQILQWTDDKMKPCPSGRAWGLYYLKGGDISEELAALPQHRTVRVFPLSDFLADTWFEGKKAVYIAPRR